jgi:hypothetical protein
MSLAKRALELPKNSKERKMIEEYLKELRDEREKENKSSRKS